MILDRPPASAAAIDAEKLEHQKVVVDFRLSEGIPEDTRHYVIQRDKSGSYEVLSTGLIEDDKVSNEAVVKYLDLKSVVCHYKRV